MAGNQPAAGDVIITADLSTGRGFTLSVAPDGPSQLWYSSYEKALHQAFEWASNTGVTIWRTAGPSGFNRIPGQN